MVERSFMTTKTAAPLFSDALTNHTSKWFNAIQPCDIFHGLVSNVNPLEIMIDQKHVLGENYLTLTNAVRDYSVDVSVSWFTDEESEHVHGNGNGGNDTTPSTEPHKHNIKGKKKIIVHNGLTKGEWVLLLRKQGGNDYIVLDRTFPLSANGEWI